ncbi:UNVERIFIED_CONTAM: hypothetical protein NCL1_51964 [Trichonephila clavipes]
MNTKFWPSLQLIAYARVAQGILYTLDLDDLKHKFQIERRGCNYIEEIDEKLSEIVLPTYSEIFSRLTAARRNPEDVINVPLQPQIKKQLRGIVIALGLEVKQWFKSHEFILIGGCNNLRNKLSWLSFGVIDRLQTARNFIHDEDWNIGERFHFACQYCFEDDVQMLWRSMTAQCRRDTVMELPKTSNMWLWMDTLHRNIPRNWEAISNNPRGTNFFVNNLVGIRSYFPNLRNPEMRCHCIRFALNSENAHNYDLYVCISLLNTGEFSFLRTSLRLTEFRTLLKSFLEWPFQIIFLDLVKDFEIRINQEVFNYVVNFILRSKLGPGFQDHMYVEIFVPFWNSFSAMYGRRIQTNTELYCLVRCVLKHSKDYDVRPYRHMLNMYFSE